MRASVIFAAGAVLLTAPAAAANDRVRLDAVPSWVKPSALMPVPEDAAGLLFLRRNDLLINFDSKGSSQHQGIHAKILHPNALELGNLAITWNPFAGEPIVHAVRVHRGAATIDVLKQTSFEVLRREDQLEAAMLTGVLTAVLRVPDLRVGDELEVSFTVPASDPTLGGKDAGMLLLTPEPSPGRYRFGLSWRDGHEPRLKAAQAMAGSVVRQRGSATFNFDNPPLLAVPEDAPTRYRWQRVVEFSDFPDWATVSRQFSPLYDQASKLSPASPVKQEAKRIAAAHKGELDRASAALKLVQQEVRYIHVGLDGGNLKPASAEETWSRRYGDCKGKTTLLLALLAEMGIGAEAVLVNNSRADDGLDERLPSPALFDHVLVRARIDGSDYWLDGTLPAVATPSRAPLIDYRWVLPVRVAGASIERLKWTPATEPNELTLYEIDARAGFDQPARITTSSITRGLAGLKEHVQYSALTPGQLLTSLRQKLVGDTWQAVDDVQWRYDSKARASVLTIVGTGLVDWEDDGAGAKSLILPGGGFNPPSRRIRAAGQGENLPYYTEPEFNCRVTTVRLPKTTQVSHWSYNSTFDTRMFGRNYYRAMELRDGAIRMVRGSRVEQPEIDAGAAMRDNARIAAFDNSMAVISYLPDGSGPDTQARSKVPATYEIDWTAANVPCLATPAN